MKQNNSKLEEDQYQLQLYRMSGLGGVCTFGMDEMLTLRYGNDLYFQMLGYQPEELIQKSCSVFIHPDDFFSIKTAIMQARNKQQSAAEFETRIVSQNGSIKYTLFRGSFCVRNGDEVLEGYTIDITKQKNLEAALYFREEQLHLATQLVEKRYNDEMEYSEAIQSENLLVKARSNITQNIVESYIAKEKVGISTDGMLYTVWTEDLAQTGFTEEEKALIRRNLNREQVLKAFDQGETTHSMDYQRKAQDGCVIWVNTTVKTYQNPETKDIMSFIYIYDIHEEKIKDEIIQAISTLEHDFIIYIDLKTNRYKMYLGKEDNVRMPPKQGDNYVPIMQSINRAVTIPEDVERAVADMLPERIKENLKVQQVFSAVYGAWDTDGIVRQKRIQYAYLDAVNERVVMIRSDVTELFYQQKQQQDMLRAALLAAEQANCVKSDFLSRMSHEIRTPMNAIIGMSAIAEQLIGDNEQAADCIHKIDISSHYLLSLINDILDMSRIESGKMLLKKEKIPFKVLLNDINAICSAQAKTKNINYENTLDSNLEDCYIGDAIKLQQVLINLLSNAAKFTPENGKISFEVRQIKKTQNDAVLRFTIHDTGCGISETFIPHMFDAFSQEQTSTAGAHNGTGLGLAICKNLVAMMDGTINVNSIVGVGTKFTVNVKLGLTEESRTKYLNTHYNFSGLNILVVDSDVISCGDTLNALKKIGANAQWIDSDKKVIDRVKQKWGRKEHYDLILMDWKMPGIDRIETVKQIRSIIGANVPIIMIADEWEAIEHDAKLAGVNWFISKPIIKSALIFTLQEIFNHKQNEIDHEHQFRISFEGKRILLAEDHPLNVEVAKKLLERKGFQVEHAENGLHAIEMFTTTPVGYYDAILMDIRMPEMDGLQAAHHIRQWRKKDAKTIPIIAMTANSFERDMEEIRAVGMNAYLAKPIDPKQMYQILFRLIYE